MTLVYKGTKTLFLNSFFVKMAKCSEVILNVEGKVSKVDFDGINYYIPNQFGHIIPVEEDQLQDYNVDINISRNVLQIAEKMNLIEERQNNNEYLTYYNVANIAQEMLPVLQKNWNCLSWKEKDSLLITTGWGMVIYCVTKDPFIMKYIQKLTISENGAENLCDYIVGQEANYYFYNSQIITRDEFVKNDLSIILDKISNIGPMFGIVCRKFRKETNYFQNTPLLYTTFFLDQMRIMTYMSNINCSIHVKQDILNFFQKNPLNLNNINDKINTIIAILNLCKIEINVKPDQDKIYYFCDILSNAWTKIVDHKKSYDICNKFRENYTNDINCNTIFVNFYENLILRIDEMSYIEKIWFTTFF
jgi:hypothetical protein